MAHRRYYTAYAAKHRSSEWRQVGSYQTKLEIGRENDEHPDHVMTSASNPGRRATFGSIGCCSSSRLPSRLEFGIFDWKLERAPSNRSRCSQKGREPSL